MQRGSHTLTRVVNVGYLTRYFRTKLRRFYPAGERLILVRATEVGLERFKRAFKYTLTYSTPDGCRIVRIIRGNVPSRHRLHELVVADRALRRLRASGFSQGRIQLPLPLGYDRSLRLFLYQDCPGTTLAKALVSASLREQLAMVDGATRGIESIHNLRIRGPLTWTIRSIKRDIGYFRDDFARSGTTWKTMADPLLDRLTRAMISAHTKRAKSFRLIHGDYSPYNIIIRDKGFTIIDFGNSLQADPLLDLASFASQLELLGARGTITLARAMRLIKHFEHAYWKPRHRTSISTARLEAYATYRAWWFLQAGAYLISTQPLKKNLSLFKYIFNRSGRLLGLTK